MALHPDAVNRNDVATLPERVTDASAPLPRLTLREAALAAWRSPRLFALLLLVVATIAGAQLRFDRLTRLDMNGDEGASWAAAFAPSVQLVAKMEARIDPGKLALYDLVLHEWIRAFGDSTFAMRAMSAGLGTIAIVLVFVSVHEVCRSLADEPMPAVAELAAGFAALLYATNVEIVTQDRIVRMYPLLMCAELLQITFFVRAQRRGGISNYLGTAIFTAAMVASNFVSALLLAAEAVWLGWLLLEARWDAQSRRLAVFLPGCSVLAGIAILLPWLPRAIAQSQLAVRVGAIDWLEIQPVSWPYTMLRDSTGDHTLFWMFMLLGAFGSWRQWPGARRAAEFLGIWTIGPFMAVMAITYFIHSLEFPRYVLIALVGMFGFAALGAASVRSTALRVAFAIGLAYLSVGPVRDRINNSREAAWHDATILAARETTAGEQVAVFPAWLKNVVRFYMPLERRSDAVGMQSEKCSSAPVMVLSGRGVISDQEFVAAQACYPRLIARLQMVEVRGR
jgi:hypothetical protein